MNEAFFRRFHVDEHGLAQGVLNDPYADIMAAQMAFRSSVVDEAASRPTSTPSSRQTPISDVLTRPGRGEADMRNAPDFSGAPLSVSLGSIYLDHGSSKATLVGMTGFEPATSSSRTTRATKLRHIPMLAGVPANNCSSIAGLKCDYEIHVSPRWVARGGLTAEGVEQHG